MKGYIAPTDHGWWQFLRARPDLGEVNFWRPGPGAFRVLAPGAPFFFKLKSPYNAIAGFGLFARFAAMPLWRAWELFGQANGTIDRAAFSQRLGSLSFSGPTGFDRLIGCIAVTETVFFSPDEWVAQPSGWKANTVQGAGYDLGRGEGARVWAQCLERAAARPSPDWVHEADDARRHGKPVIIRPRLGQVSFRLAVLDAYGGACAVTTEHSLPVLDAAHIQPWAAGGAHVVPNGLPLRSDLHRLFDLGFVTVRPDGHFAVSSDLREAYSNGRTYYALDGTQIALPADPTTRPSADALAWHNESVFRN
ncbi:MAG: restriction endonuclease-like protein [Conexibacter sp.]|nr:restriction endonuclease-like protein [Conexibacter sp.]